MDCPFCGGSDTGCYETRKPKTEEGKTPAIGRRRRCVECGKRFSTVETYGSLVLKLKYLVKIIIDLWE